MAEATVRYAWPSGTGSAPCTVSTQSTARCNLSTAWNLLVAGDELVIGAGTYNLSTTLNTQASGTSGSKIYVHGENFTQGGAHNVLIRGVIIDSNNPNAGNDCGGNWDTICINHDWWIIEGLDIGLAYRVAHIYGSHVEFRHNLVHDFKAHGIELNGGTTDWVHHNAILNMRGVTLNDPEWFNDTNWGGLFVLGGSGHTIEHNASYSNTDNGFTGATVGPVGLGIGGVLTNNVTVRGNLMMDNAKTVGGRFFGQDPVVGVFDCAANPSQCTSGIFMDSNILAYGTSGSMGMGENSVNGSMSHNVFYNVEANAPGGKADINGLNAFNHNTCIQGPYSLNCFQLDEFNNIFAQNSTVKDNLMYSDLTITTTTGNGPFLAYIGSSSAILSPTTTNFNYNQYYRPGTIWNVFTGVSYGANDIHGSTAPTFTNATIGDYSLASGSLGAVGNNPASDGTNRGANWDGIYIKKSIMQHVVQMPVLEQTTSGASHTFTVSGAPFNDSTQGRRYQLFAYFPIGYSPTSGTEQFTIQGVAADTGLIDRSDPGGQLGAVDPVRYWYLGTYYPDGSNQITVSWVNSTLISKLQLRQMPSPQEAYVWMTEQVAPPPSPSTIIFIQ